MNKDKALRLALEALEANDLLVNGTEKSGGLVWCMDGYYSDCFDIEPINKQTEEAIIAIKAVLEEKNEPVAWYRDEDGIRIYYESKVWDDATPLYKKDNL